MTRNSELDSLIAERVMGWHWYSPSHYAMAADGARPCWCGEGAQHHHDSSWSPSSNIAHAWEVVERMCALKPRLVLHGGDTPPWFAVDAPNPDLPYDSPAKTEWQAGFRNAYDYEGEGWCVGFPKCAPTAPLAICHAALAAVSA